MGSLSLPTTLNNTEAENVGYLQSWHGSCCCPGGQLSGSAALESAGAAAADGGAAKGAAGAHIQDSGQRDQEPDRPESHVWHRTGLVKHTRTDCHQS